MLRGVVSDPDLVRAAGRLRVIHLTLELGVFFVVAGSAAAFGAVHPASYTRVWLACLGLGMLVLARSIVAARLRRALGRVRLGLDFRGRWSTTPVPATPEPSRWSCDLGHRVLLASPLLIPGACFIAWAAFQLVPLPPPLLGILSPDRASIDPASPGGWLPLSVSAPDTRRGLAFLVAALLAHVAASTTLARDGARARFLRGLSLLGLAFSLLGLVQLVRGTTRIYGVFEPHEGGGSIFGPFVNRNHFAGYMLMVIPVALAVFARAGRRSGRGEERTGLAAPGACPRHARRHRADRLVAADPRSHRGAAGDALPRGLLAFLASLALLSLRLRRTGILWVAGLAVAAALSGLGLERLQDRIARTSIESQTRTLVWQDSFERSRAFRLGGTGFNTYAAAFSSAEPWSLPAGATPWPAGGSPQEVLGPREGRRSPPAIEGHFWYREAHNDYLQVLLETGIPGLLLALWGAGAALRGVRHDPWLLAALVGVLLQEFVDFGLQIPALSLLFVVLAGMQSSAGDTFGQGSTTGTTERGRDSSLPLRGALAGTYPRDLP